MCGRDTRSVSEEKGNAAIYTQVLRLASVVETSYVRLDQASRRREKRIHGYG